MHSASGDTVLSLSGSVKLHVRDQRFKHRSVGPRAPNARIVSRCMHVQAERTLQLRHSNRQLPGPVTHFPEARRRSALTSLSVFASFQSPTGAPIEHTQPLQPSASGPKFQPFTPETGVRQDLLSYRHKVKVAHGSILVRPLTHAWVHACGGLLTEAFADAMGYVPMYRTYLRHQIRQYLYRHADMPPKAVVLVALLIPEAGSESQQLASEPASSSGGESDAGTSLQELEASTSEQEQEQGAILVGTVELSFAASSRTRYLTLNAPVNCAYLSNMAVNANYRRRGYGNILLDAADDVARVAGEKQIYLHLRFQDAAPASLYKQAGYVSDKADSFLVRLLGLDRRYLMKKQQK